MARLHQLAEDRRRLAELKHWRARAGSELLAERARLHAEGWDALRELRQVLEERQDVLGRIEQHLRDQYEAAKQAHGRAVAAAERRLGRRRRRLVKANRATAGSCFADLVDGDDSVRGATHRLAEARQALDGVASDRRRVLDTLSAVTARQREVFAGLTS